MYVLEHHQISQRLFCTCWCCSDCMIVADWHFSSASALCVCCTAHTGFRRHHWCKYWTTTSTLLSHLNVKWNSGWQGYWSLKFLVGKQPMTCHIASVLASFLWHGRRTFSDITPNCKRAGDQHLVADTYSLDRVNYWGAESLDPLMKSSGIAKSLILE
jgi:hypothetical protein